MSNQEGYRAIAKNTAILGGAQIVQMLVTLIRTKFVAVLLGPYGMGVNTLILSAVTTIQQFSSLGIFQSGVRDLSYSNTLVDKTKVAKLRKIFDWLTLFCGILGSVVCIMLSPWLSKFLFGDYAYIKYFVMVAVALLFIALQNGKATIMQATQNLRQLAKSTIYGALINLLLTVPMFYFWGIDGIVPGIVTGSAVFYLVNLHFERRILFVEVGKPSKAEVVACAKPIVKLGWVLMMSQLMMVTFTFLLNGFISNYGSVEDVGLFQVVSSICMQGVVIINTTLVSDYYPRLSIVYNDSRKIKEVISRQSELVFFLVAIISTLLILLAPWVICVLLSRDFLSVVPMLRIMSLALIFRTISVVLELVILAKGDTRTYFLCNALLGSGFLFLLNIVTYHFWGLDGLAYSYLFGSVVILMILVVLTRLKYNFSFSRKQVRIFVSFVIMLVLTCFFAMYLNNIWGYILAILFSGGILVGSLYGLNKILDIWQMLFTRFK